MQRFSSVPCLNPCNYHTNFTADRKRSLTKDRLHDCAPPAPGKFIGMRDGNGIESGTHEALTLEKYGIPENSIYRDYRIVKVQHTSAGKRD